MPYRKPDTWLDKIDADIMPYVDAEGWISRYPTLSPLEMRSNEKEQLQSISAALFVAFNRLVEVLRAHPETMPFNLLNMTDKLTPFLVDDDADISSYISRLDFVKDLDGVYKLVEINADTPCGMPETFYANKIAERYFAEKNFYHDLNERSTGKELVRPFLRLLRQKKYANRSQIRIAFAASDEYAEDFANARFVFETVRGEIRKYALSEVPCSCRLLALTDLIIKDDGVYMPNDIFEREDKIDILYRLHPLELLMDDVSEDGFPIGLKLLDLANMGLVDLVNPIKAILLQNKAIMAIAWYLYENKMFWREDERQLLAEHLTPTYLSSSALSGTRFIKKPIFGREGAGIAIVENDGKCSYEAEEECDDCDLIYQKFIASQDQQQETDAGIMQGKYTYSCFVIDGQASETFVRLSPAEITGVEALFVPLIDRK